MKKIWQIMGVVLFTLMTNGLLVAQNSPNLNVPLNVSDITGFNRVNEICSTGVPLPYGAVNDINQIRVEDSKGNPIPAQFKILERWLDKGLEKGNGSVKWLLISFYANVNGGTTSNYFLRTGSNPAPNNPATLVENTNHFVLSGLTIPKKLSGPFEVVFTDEHNNKISASELETLTWSIWENGPIRNCIKGMSKTEVNKFGFEVYIYSYGNNTGRYDMTVVLKNTPKQNRGPLYFKDFSVHWSPSQVANSQNYILGGEWGHFVEGSGNASIYQCSSGSDGWQTLGYDKSENTHSFIHPAKGVKPIFTPSFRGYQMKNGSNQIVGNGNYALGYVGLKTSGKSALLLKRHFRKQSPIGSSVKLGQLSMNLWPEEWSKSDTDHWLDDLQKKSHDLSFRIINGSLQPKVCEEEARKYNSPLMIYSGIDYYREIGVPGYITTRRQNVQPDVLTEQEESEYNWITYGGDTTDRIRRRYHFEHAWSKYILSGDPLDGMDLFYKMRHDSTMTPIWVDNYSYPDDRDALSVPLNYTSPSRATGGYKANTDHHGYMGWNAQHFVIDPIMQGYRIFGDPLAYDALRDIGTWTRHYFDYRLEGNEIPVTRFDALPLENIIWAYRVFEDEALLHHTNEFMHKVVFHQIDKDRGYYQPHFDLVPPAEKPFMLQYLVRGLHEHWQVTGDELGFDLSLGIMDYIEHEGLVDDYSGIDYETAFDYAYQQNEMAQIRNENSSGNQQLNFRAWQTTELFAWAYDVTGKVKYKNAFDKLVVGGDRATLLHRVWLNFPFDKDWGLQSDYLYDHGAKADGLPPGKINNLNAEDLGGGKVRLTWSAPSGAPYRYQIKYSNNLPMVDKLNFPSQVGQVRNWWAAYNISGEPKGGGNKTMTANDVSSGVKTFAIRSYDGEGNLSELSNQITIGVNNNAPKASPNELNTTPNQKKSVVLKVSDEDGDEVNIVITKQPAQGTLSIDQKTKSVTFSPKQGFSGFDEFKYVASDGQLNSAVSTVVIHVANAVNKSMQDGVNDYDGCADGYISVHHPDKNFGNNATLIGSPVNEKYSLIKFNIFQKEGGPIPNNASVISATLTLHQSNELSSLINVHESLVDWSEYEMTWQLRKPSIQWSQPGGKGIGVDFNPDIVDSQNNAQIGFVNFDVTDSLVRFKNGWAQNHGWKLLLKRWNTTSDGSRNFDSSEASDQTKRPKLVIRYAAEGVSPNLPPDARDDSVTVNVNESITINILSNDSDPDNDSFSIISVSKPQNGVAQINGKSVVYSNTSSAKEDQFVYTIEDSNGAVDTATVIVSINGGDTLPPTEPDPNPDKDVDLPGGEIAYEGFEGGLGGGSGWSDDWQFSPYGVSIKEGESFQGQNRLNFYNDKGIATRTVNLSGVQNVYLSFYAHTKYYADGENTILKVFDGTWHTLAVLDKQFLNQYSQVVIDLSIYNKIAGFKIQFEVNPGTNGYCFIDEIFISGSSSMPELMVEDGFESGPSGGVGWASSWQFSKYTPTYSGHEPHEGTNSLMFHNDNRSATRKIQSTKFRPTKLEFFARTLYYDENDQFSIQVYDGVWRTAKVIAGSLGEGFVKLSVNLSNFDHHPDFQIKFESLSNTTGYFFIDALKVYGSPLSSAVLAEDDFEGGQHNGSGWSTGWDFSQYGVSYTNTFVNEGNQALQLHNHLASIKRSLDIRNTNDLVLTFDARTNYFKNTSGMTIKVFDGVWHTVKNIGEENNGKFISYEINLSTYQKIQNFQIKFEPVDGNTGYFFLDDLKVLVLE